MEFAAKYLRFFYHTDETTFSLFIECGVERHLEVQVMEDFGGVILKVEIPIPPDELLQLAGYHAVTISLEGINEEFNIPTPKKLKKPLTRKIFQYPSSKLPLWIVYKYDLEEEEEQATIDPDKFDINLVSLLSKDK